MWLAGLGTSSDSAVDVQVDLRVLLGAAKEGIHQLHRFAQAQRGTESKCFPEPGDGVIDTGLSRRKPFCHGNLAARNYCVG